jgi:hypothetical protein
MLQQFHLPVVGGSQLQMPVPRLQEFEMQSAWARHTEIPELSLQSPASPARALQIWLKQQSSFVRQGWLSWLQQVLALQFMFTGNWQQSWANTQGSYCDPMLVMQQEPAWHSSVFGLQVFGGQIKPTVDVAHAVPAAFSWPLQHSR